MPTTAFHFGLSFCGDVATVTDTQPGDGLFIPEGWWHQVDSSPGNVAVNFWFTGAAADTILRALEASPPAHQLDDYVCRIAIARAVQAAKARLREEHRALRQLPGSPTSSLPAAWGSDLGRTAAVHRTLQCGLVHFYFYLKLHGPTPCDAKQYPADTLPSIQLIVVYEASGRAHIPGVSIKGLLIKVVATELCRQCSCSDGSKR